jgi:5'-AMP-activated protein kinase catalytic alpha subunit
LLEYYSIGRILGRGSFGKVNLALHKLTRKIVAVKSVNKNLAIDEERMKKVDNEINLMSKMRHKNVCKYFERLETDQHNLFIMEVCQGGDLLSYVRRRRRLEEPIAKFIFKQVIAGLGYIHSLKIIHRDIKLENILIDNEGVVKIADFGISHEIKPEQKAVKDICGTVAYMAPEMILRQKAGYDTSVDIWSAGVLLYVMIYGCLPF